MAQPIELTHKDAYSTITCHAFWNITLFQIVVNQFVDECLKNGSRNLVIDFREPEDVKHSKNFLMDLRYALERAHGIASTVVFVVKDKAGAAHLDAIMQNFNKHSHKKVSMSVTHSIRAANKQASGT